MIGENVCIVFTLMSAFGGKADAVWSSLADHRYGLKPPPAKQNEFFCPEYFIIARSHWFSGAYQNGRQPKRNQNELNRRRLAR
jgi:hypothetical protein